MGSDKSVLLTVRQFAGRMKVSFLYAFGFVTIMEANGALKAVGLKARKGKGRRSKLYDFTNVLNFDLSKGKLSKKELKALAPKAEPKAETPKKAKKKAAKVKVKVKRTKPAVVEMPVVTAPAAAPPVAAEAPVVAPPSLEIVNPPADAAGGERLAA